GNFGSIDDDPPAAMRYTEARLSAIAEEMLADIERDTVDFADNFDSSLREPLVLPARLPNLLVNGAYGIAVGMATSIPPHNLSEVCDAVCHLIDNPDASVDELLEYVQGPDFPTGGTIMGGVGREHIRQAYSTGQGRVVLQAKADIVEIGKSGRRQIVVSEVPYQVNKASLVEKIATLAREKKIEGITDIRDESDREGLRVVIDLRREASAETVLNNLYKHTAMQTTATVNLLALVEGQPRVLNLKQVLRYYIDFRTQVVTRRARFDLRKAQERAHILEGLRIALSALEEVIRIIRGAADAEAAREALMGRFGLTHVQAQAILDMQLRRLTALDRQKLEEEYLDLRKTIAELEALLADPAKVLAVARQETVQLKQEFGDGRRTQILEEGPREFTRAETEPHVDVVVTLSRNGYIKRIPATTYRLQHRGGKGVVGMVTREDDVVWHMLVADTHDTLLFFTDRGRAYALRCYQVPADTSRTSRGTPLANLVSLVERERERVTSVEAVPSTDLDAFILLTTHKGEIKRMPLRAFSHIRASGLIAMDLEPEDELVSARVVAQDEEVIVISQQGMAVRFPASEVSLRSRQAGGVRAMRVARGDTIVAMDVVTPRGKLLTISQLGYGKQTPLSEFPSHHRGGKGVTAFRVDDRTGLLAVAQVLTVTNGQELVVATAKAQVLRTTLAEVSQQHRSTRGVSIMRPEPGDQIISAALVADDPRLAQPKTEPPRASP
ncbi:MAG: DNA gyrase subunit A, partial [Chloroflexi bacterium]|nr:DNA gyrase subunit A [Chloroflexota bacterium]